MLKFFFVLLISCSIIDLNAQVKMGKDKLREANVCDTIMNFFSEGKITNALELLKQNSNINSADIDELEGTITGHMKDFILKHGKITSSEFIVEKNIKDFISKRIYLLKFENYYLVFEFLVYKRSSGWTIVNFKYDENLADLFK